jgi:hypothetical protein
MLLLCIYLEILVEDLAQDLRILGVIHTMKAVSRLLTEAGNPDRCLCSNTSGSTDHPQHQRGGKE